MFKIGFLDNNHMQLIFDENIMYLYNLSNFLDWKFLVTLVTKIDWLVNSNGEISACCKGERDFFGEMPDGSKLSWRFLEDFSNEETYEEDSIEEEHSVSLLFENDSYEKQLERIRPSIREIEDVQLLNNSM